MDVSKSVWDEQNMEKMNSEMNKEARPINDHKFQSSTPRDSSTAHYPLDSPPSAQPCMGPTYKVPDDQQNEASSSSDAARAYPNEPFFLPDMQGAARAEPKTQGAVRAAPKTPFFPPTMQGAVIRAEPKTPFFPPAMQGAVIRAEPKTQGGVIRAEPKTPFFPRAEPKTPYVITRTPRTPSPILRRQ
jgi:hypothetical protein